MEKHSDSEHQMEDRILDLLSEPLVAGQYENIKDGIVVAKVDIKDIAGGQFISVESKNVDEETMTYITVSRQTDTKQVLSVSAMQLIKSGRRDVVYLYYPGSETVSDLINISNLNMLVELVIESQTQAKDI